MLEFWNKESKDSGFNCFVNTLEKRRSIICTFFVLALNDMYGCSKTWAITFLKAITALNIAR